MLAGFGMLASFALLHVAHDFSWPSVSVTGMTVAFTQANEFLKWLTTKFLLSWSTFSTLPHTTSFWLWFIEHSDCNTPEPTLNWWRWRWTYSTSVTIPRWIYWRSNLASFPRCKYSHSCGGCCHCGVVVLPASSTSVRLPKVFNDHFVLSSKL